MVIIGLYFVPFKTTDCYFLCYCTVIFYRLAHPREPPLTTHRDGQRPLSPRSRIFNLVFKMAEARDTPYPFIFPTYCRLIQPI